jgi:hypothetical protein
MLERPEGNAMNIHTDSEPQPVKKSAIRTRGAVTGHNVRYVLGFGLAATIIAFIVIAFYFGSLPN